MALETTAFDPAEYLDNDEAIAGYLSDALETGNGAFIADALGVVASAGVWLPSEECGLTWL
ncbi:probable addiction module antidote protein [Paracoccus pantotrophus]|nr:probable addiction module antidote protein [Paracoccus pantotrophus]